MAYAIKYRRGTTAEHASFTGAAGEVTINTTTNELVVHDGVTVGGHVIGSSGGGGGGASTLTDLNITDGTAGQVLTTDGAGTFTFTTLSNSGGTTIISPAAFAYVNTIPNGSGTNISWSNWNNSAGTLDFTFTTPQSDVNYAVISDNEGYDDVNIQVTSKSTTGFTVSIYNDAGEVKNPGGIGTFSIIVYSSTPTLSVSGSSSGGSDNSVYILADMTALIAKTGMVTGDKAYLTSNNNFYLYIGTGWYLIATVQNDAPSVISNVDSEYSLNIDGTPTVITAAATDPEGFPLTWSYAVTGGSLGATTITQVDNVFTITPSTNAADGGEFTLTIGATDGANGAVSTSTSLSLTFNVSNSRYTSLLVTAIGTSDNKNITDSSTNNHSITVQGEPQAGTFSPYRHGGYSLYFDGSGDKLTLSGNTVQEDFSFGNNSWSIECWLYPTGSQGPIFNTHRVGNPSGYYLTLAGTNQLLFGTYGMGWDGDYWSAYNAYTLNEWNHISLNRDADSGNSLKLYTNGVLLLSTTLPTDFTGFGFGPYIGGYDAGGTQYDLGGYISDFAVTKGSVLRTGGTSLGDVVFTPPTEALVPDSNTKLLISNSVPYIKDSSSRSHDITKTGNVSKSTLTPYDYPGYTSSSNGGSVYFDGSGDYLDLDFAAIGTSDFTIECWIYVTSSSANELICDFRPTGSDNSTGIWMYFSSSNKLVVGTGGVVYITGTTTYPDNQWVHVSLQRQGGGLLTLYGNGILQGTKSNVSTNLTSTDMRVGTNRSAASVYHGYISDFKLVKSALRVDANGSHLPYFDLPTEPSDSTGTEIHIKGTDASIIDKAQTSNLILTGNTTGSTTEVKFANSKSIYFDGNGDYITAAANSSILGDGDFTVETWIYANSINLDSSYRCICSQGSGGNSFRMFLNGTTIQVWRGASQMINYENSTVANTWYHIAYSDDTLYVNGQSVTTIPTPGFDHTLTSISIGGNDNGSINGYMADFRITNGLARYTTNFTPPTSSLKG